MIDYTQFSPIAAAHQTLPRLKVGEVATIAGVPIQRTTYGYAIGSGNTRSLLNVVLMLQARAEPITPNIHAIITDIRVRI